MGNVRYRLHWLILGLLLVFPLEAQTVRFNTNMGDIDVQLLPESAPRTVENFLGYVRRGDYSNSFIHRSVRNFVIQGGGYRFLNNQIAEVPEGTRVVNEFRVSNTRGTLAMAKLDGNPNSATNQWFFNTADNSRTLNNSNGGFTVFGRIANAAGLAVMDRIAALTIWNAGAPFGELPLQNYPGFGNITANNLVMINSITVLEPVPAIASNGIISASNFGGFAHAAPGSYIEIYGSNLAVATRGWAGTDFTDGKAPTSLENVSVTIDGQPAYVNYVSPGQVNVQVPADLPTGGTVRVVVTNNGRASESVQLALRPRMGGLLAPPSFKVSDKQYVAAVHASTGALVSNGSVPNVPAAPARPGEVLIFYGIGFGPVAGGTPIAGQVATGTTSLAANIEFRVGDLPAQVSYSGLAPDLVGVYQFNVTVPATAPNGDLPLRVTVDGQAIEQTLFLPVQPGP